MDIDQGKKGFRQVPVIDPQYVGQIAASLPARCQVTVAMESPGIALIDDFLTDAECDALIELGNSRLTRSTVAIENGESVSDDRTSDGCFFLSGETDLVEAIEQRIELVTLWPSMKMEGFNFLRYEDGGTFKKHHDFFHNEDSVWANEANGGQRVATIIIYLNDVHGQGETEFTKRGLKVYPRKGSMLFFSYPETSIECLSEHTGLPVFDVAKHVAVKWFREFPIMHGE